jgi:hypothetical protein
MVLLSSTKSKSMAVVPSVLLNAAREIVQGAVAHCLSAIPINLFSTVCQVKLTTREERGSFNAGRRLKR